jgi:hypothetical protein
MRPSVLRSLLLIALLATAVAGCSNSNTVTAPSTTPVLTTETFTGTLSPAGTNYYTFIAKTGNVVMTMQSIGPDPTLKIGMQIGVFNGLSCTAAMDNPSTAVGSTLFGLATATTSMCVAIYDPGTVPTGATVTYTVTVDHY